MTCSWQMRLRLGGCLILLLFSLILDVPEVFAHAEKLVQLNEPTTFFTTVAVFPNELLKIKGCFSEHELPPLFCEGETWNGEAWIKQRSSWTLFPDIVTDSEGKAVIEITVRLMTEQLLPYFHIVADGKSMPLATWQTKPLLNSYTITIYPFRDNQPADEGYLVMTENGHERVLPLLGRSSITTYTGTKLIGLALVDELPYVNVSMYPVTLVSVNSKVRLGNSDATNVIPSLSYEGVPRLGETMTWRLENIHGVGPWHWSVNGQMQNNQTVNLITKPTSPGRYVVTVHFPMIDQIVTREIWVEGVYNLVIESLVPKPEGKDNQEVITIKNNNPFPVTLDDWKIQSLTSQTNIKLEGIIHAYESKTFFITNKLVNNNGRYSLLNSVGDEIDRVVYGKPMDNQLLQDNRWEWVQSEKTSGTDQPEKITVTGTVVKPNGRTIDIETGDGPVRVVLHSSFTGVKPRLSKGDIITVTGTWKRSRRGPYLSVAEGDLFFLVSQAKTENRKSTKSVTLVPKVQAKTIVEPLIKVQPPHHMAVSSIMSFTYPQGVRIILGLLLSLGVILTLPIHRYKSL